MADLYCQKGDDARATEDVDADQRSSRDWNFAPELVGASPFWLAARFNEP
jgi:hypothetical protein